MMLYMCSRASSCYSNSYRAVWLLMSRKFSNNVSHPRLLSGVNSKTPKFLTTERKSFTESFLQSAKYFSTGPHSLSVGKNVHKLPQNDENQEFRTIYKHPDIRMFGLISKIKSVVYVFALADIAYGLCTFQSPDTNPTTYFIGFTLTMAAAINMTIFSQYASQFVGVIRINDNNQTVKVSHLNFRGNRKDIYMDPKDIVPLSETSYTDYNKAPFLTKDGTVKLYISFTKGLVLDHDTFCKIIG